MKPCAKKVTDEQAIINNLANCTHDARCRLKFFRAVLRELSVANEVLLNPEEVYGFFLAVEDAVVDLDAIFNQGSEEAAA